MRWDRFYVPSAALLCVLRARRAFAGDFTVINPPHPGEDSHQAILSHIYGGTFNNTDSR